MAWSGAHTRFHPATKTSLAWVRKTYVTHQKRDRERCAYELILGCSLTPHLYTSGYNALGQAYNDFEWIDARGRVLNLQEHTQNWRSVGTLLGRMVYYSRSVIAKKGIPNFTLFQKSYAWEQFIRDKIDSWERRILSSEGIESRVDFCTIIKSCRTMLSEMVGKDTALVHGDYTQQNIIWDQGNQIWKIMDFGAALIGDPRFDFRKNYLG